MRLRVVTQGILCIFAAGTLCAQNPSSPAKAAPTTHAAAKSISGSLHGSSYTNPFFGFSCEVPFGWVDRTQEMGEGANQPARAQVLLAFFEHPPEAVTKTVNSAVVITAENATVYKGLKTAADYFPSVTEAATAQGFKTVQDPYEFQVGNKRLVRGDFSAQRGTQTIFQSTLVTLRKGYVISFTLISGSEDEVNDLIERLKL